MVRLFGWDVFTNFYARENLVFAEGIPDPGEGLSETDSRTLRFSIQAGVDLTPLIRE